MSNKVYYFSKLTTGVITMTTGEKKKTLTGSIRNLFGSPKRKIEPPQKRKPDLYFKYLWLSRTVCEAVAFVAKVEHLSFKGATEFLIEEGFSKYMGKIIIKSVEDRKDPDYKPPREIKLLRKLIRERGIQAKVQTDKKKIL